VIDAVAGVRMPVLIDWTGIHACHAPMSCQNGGNCGGGGAVDPCDLVSCKVGEICTLMTEGKVECIAPAASSSVCVGECIAGSSEACQACPNVFGTRTCSTVNCTWSACFKPSVPELCGDGVDNDCNGAIDCQDSSCAATSICSWSMPGAAGGGGGGQAGMMGQVSEAGSGGIGPDLLEYRDLLGLVTRLALEVRWVMAVLMGKLR